MNESSGSITVKQGALYLDVALYVQCLASVPTVVLLRDAEDLLVLPVRVGASGGGYLVKIRNALGDRVVHAPEFLREHGIEDSMERSCTADWSEARGALVARGLFAEGSIRRADSGWASVGVSEVPTNPSSAVLGVGGRGSRE